MDSVIDTSTLISLAKINYLELIPILRTDIALPAEIYEEAVEKGEKKGFADATVIKQFIERHRIKVLSVKARSIVSLRNKMSRILTEGDEAVLSLALQEKAKEMIANDDGLGRIAMALGLHVKATPDLLLEALRGNVLSLEDFENFVKSLVIQNRLSSAIAELYIVQGRKDVER
jgi:predicted nucleic acid-binding protein